MIAPAKSLSIISPEVRELATQRWNALGFTISYGQRAEESGPLGSAPLEACLSDFHAAFADPKVDCILTAIGGYNSHELPPYIDWDLVAANPKPLSGFSDITALQNELYAKLRMVSYAGPHFSQRSAACMGSNR